MIRVRLCVSADREFVLSLAPRLAIGMRQAHILKGAFCQMILRAKSSGKKRLSECELAS